MTSQPGGIGSLSKKNDSLNLSFSKIGFLHFGVGFLAVGLALFFTIRIEVLSGRSLLLFAAVMFATWLGGRSVGLLALSLAIVANVYFVLPPQFSFDLDPSSAIRLATFVGLAFPMIWLLAMLVGREKLLAVSEARYRFLFDHNPFPMWVFDRETLEFLAVNDAAALSYGYSKEEFMSMTLKSIRPVEDVPLLLDHLAVHVPNKEQVKFWRHVKKDGSIIEVETSSHEINFDGRQAKLVLAHDVTEHLRSETELRNSEARLRTIVENLSEGLVVADLDGNLLTFNRAAIEMHGFKDVDDCRENVGNFNKLFKLSDLRGNQLSSTETPLSKILRREELDGLELRIDRIDKPFKRVFKFGGTVIHDSDHQPVVAIVTTSDITEQKLAEEQNRRLHETLESRVATRTAELQAVNKELESFSYSVSHDLRAPLRHISGYSQILLDDYANVLDDNGKQFLNEVRGATEEMSHLIDDVLKLARVSQGEILREEIDLSELAAEIIAKQIKSDPDRKVKVTIEKGLSAYGDWRLLNVVLTNLLENAWKFTSKSNKPEITFCHEPVVGARGYCIRDNGSGFDMKYADRLFGAFQRLHSADEFEGTGIGLATVQRIINRHGGQIWAEGAVDNGAKFYFTLPDVSDFDEQNEYG